MVTPEPTYKILNQIPDRSSHSQLFQSEIVEEPPRFPEDVTIDEKDHLDEPTQELPQGKQQVKKQDHQLARVVQIHNEIGYFEQEQKAYRVEHIPLTRVGQTETIQLQAEAQGRQTTTTEEESQTDQDQGTVHERLHKLLLSKYSGIYSTLYDLNAG